MRRKSIEHAQAESAAIDAILTTEEELIPSSGFLTSVMERVQDEARTPAPTPFPWKRAIPGIVLATGVFGWAAVEFARQAIPAMRASSFTPPQIPIPAGGHVEEAAWVAFALAISLVSWLLSRRWAGQSGSL